MSLSFGLDAKALAYRYRGEARTDAGAFQQAIADFSESIRLRPDNVPAFAGRARARFSVRNFAGALSDYSEAIRLSPVTAISTSRVATFIFRRKTWMPPSAI